MLDVRWQLIGEVAEACLRGRLDGAGAAELDRSVPEWLAGHDAILDLDGVEYLSSAGIRSVLRLVQRVQVGERVLVLAAPSPQLIQVLELSGLLGELAVEPSLAAAHTRVRAASSALAAADLVVGGRSYRVVTEPRAHAELLVWGDSTCLRDATRARSDAQLLTLAELGWAWGIAGLGAERDQAFSVCGPFVATPGLIAVQPADTVGAPDDLIVERPAEASAFVLSAVSFAGAARGRFETRATESVAELVDDLLELTRAGGEERAPAVMGFAFAAQVAGSIASAPSSFAALADPVWPRTRLAKPEPMLVLGVAWRGDRVARIGLEETALLGRAGIPTTSCEHGFSCHALRLGGSVDTELPTDPAALRRVLSKHGQRGVVRLDGHTVLSCARGAVYDLHRIADGAAGLTQVAVEHGAPLRDEWQVIARRIYQDASRICLRELTGGYSATTFQVESYDASGRRMIPTVLKIASLDFTEREERAYHEHVKKFILNNSTVIMGRADQGRSAGLRYNFVGIAGAGSSLTWLAQHYRERPFAEIEPILDTVFGTVLWAWYGQCRRQPIALYADHDPTRIFTALSQDAVRHLGVRDDEPEFACPEIGRRLPNPYHFMRFEMPKRRTRVRELATAITHGDLNLNNILLDEKENIYVIDFSETRPRNAVADFCRLEPLLLFEFTRLDRPGDVQHLARFFADLVAVGSLAEQPRWSYRGDDPLAEKAYETIWTLRRWATRVVAPDTDLLPYLLPLLEWTVPVISYRQVHSNARRLSMLCSALICERILALDP